MLDVDALAQEIRRVDGQHKLGACELAEALMPFITESAAVWIESQRRDVPAHGWEFANAIRHGCNHD